jgi:ATP-dependent Lon protease
LGGALSGRDTTGVQKTASGLIKLVSPNPDIPVPDEVLEWALRIALECRRRVKEQQKRIGSAEQNLYVRSRELVGDRDPRQHEFSIQLRAFDSAKSGAGVGVGVLLALCSSLLQKSVKGGFAITGGLNLGGSIETIFNPVAVVEIAIEKGAANVLMPISSRRQLNDLPDDLAAKVTIHYYLDARDALLKALAI